LLVYLNGNFLQILEGEREVVLTLAKRIEVDPRHQGMLTLLQRPVERRAFGDWSMGYKGPADLTADERQAFNALAESLATPGNQLTQDKVARVVVSTFISNNG
jgi:Sensors of blue-light using FAD